MGGPGSKTRARKTSLAVHRGTCHGGCAGLSSLGLPEYYGGGARL